MSLPYPYIIGLRSNPELVEKILKFLGNNSIDNSMNVPIISETFANGEIRTQITQNIRNQDVFIIQTGANDEKMSINDYLMELLSTINACKMSSASKITVIIPSFMYARSDKKDVPRTPINSALICQLLEVSGATRIVSLDLHAGQIQGSARIPFDNLYAIGLLSEYLKNNVQVNEETHVLVSPDNGGVKRIESYAKLMKMPYVIMHKQRDYTQKNVVMKSSLIGDPKHVNNKIAVIIDDMVDTCGTMVAAANELKEHGATSVIIVATHGIFSGPAFDRINSCEMIQKVVVTNSLPQEKNKEKCSKLEIVDISSLIGKVISCLMTGESISALFP